MLGERYAAGLHHFANFSLRVLQALGIKSWVFHGNVDRPAFSKTRQCNHNDDQYLDDNESTTMTNVIVLSETNRTRSNTFSSKLATYDWFKGTLR